MGAGSSLTRGVSVRGRHDAGFSALDELSDEAYISAPVPQKLKGYAVEDPIDGGSPIRNWSSSRPSPLRHLDMVMHNLHNDQSRHHRTLTNARTGRFRGNDRAFTAILDIPDDVICVVQAIGADMLAMGNARGNVMVVSWTSGSMVAMWSASLRPITALAKLDGGLMMTGAGDGVIAAWDQAGGKRFTLTGHTQDVRSIEALPAQKDLAVSGSRDCTVRLWNLATAECLHSIHLLRNVVTRLRCFSLEQVALHHLAFVQASEDLRLRFWCVEGGEKLKMGRIVHAGREQIVAVDVSPDGLVATGTKGFYQESCLLCVWDTRTMQQLHQAAAFDCTVEALRIVPRTAHVLQLVAVSVSAAMKCFSFPDLSLLWEENAATSSPYTAIDFSQDGDRTLIFTSTTLPEVFVWSWEEPVVSMSLFHPPVLRSRGEGQARPSTLASTRPVANNTAQPPSTPPPGKRPGRVVQKSSTLNSLGDILSSMQADAEAFEAKWKTGFLTTPPKIVREPQRERVKGISPLARACTMSTDDEIRTIFCEIDVNRNGWLEKDELQSYLCDYAGFGEQEVARFMQRASSVNDSEGQNCWNSRVSFESFKKHYRTLNAVWIKGRRKESFMRRPGSVGRQQFCLEECHDCQVLVCDMMDQTFVDRCSDCRILLGPSAASAFIRDCVNCTFWVATQQLRTRTCKNCRFYLYSQTEPVIEESTDLVFAPWAAAYPLCGSHFEQTGFEATRNLWNAVFDFTPPSGGKCNWRIASFHECECVCVSFEEKSEEKRGSIVPDCPTATLSHELLCRAPLESTEHTGHAVNKIQQVRPPLPGVSPEGLFPSITIGSDAVEAVHEESAGESSSLDAADANSAGVEKICSTAETVVESKVPRAPTHPPPKTSPVPKSSRAKRLVFKSGSVEFGLATTMGSSQVQEVKSALSSLRQHYKDDQDSEIDLRDASGQPPPVLSAQVNELNSICEEDENAARKVADAAKARRAIEEAEKEELEKMWDAATLANKDAALQPSAWQTAMEQSALGHVEAWQYLTTSCQLAEPAPVVRGLREAASREKDELLSIAKTKLSDESVLHMRLLQSVWLKLTHGCDLPLRVASNWQVIGFQGNDPATDLRGVGLLGLLHLLTLCDLAPKSLDAGFTASRSDKHFPFAVASFNFSKLALELLLDGRLTSVCNRANSAEMPVTNLYIGTFCTLLEKWEKEKLSIEDFGNTLKDISKKADANPQRFITHRFS